MQLDATEVYPRPYHVPFYNLRWSAVFAGLAVGVSANVILLLLGGAAGLAFANVGAVANEQGLLLAATTWNIVCMIVAALIGGYVAARAAGMRRTADGVLHGVVAWAITVLLAVLLATSVAGSTLSDMFGTGLNQSVSAESVPPVDAEQRQAVVDVLQSRLGLNAEQANHVVDQALLMAGQDEEAARVLDQIDPRQLVRAASVASSWLSAAILLSLIAAMGGGMLGARGTRRATGIEQRRPPRQEPEIGNERGAQ